MQNSNAIPDISPVLRKWRERQFEDGMELARRSDILDLHPVDPGTPPSAYVATFHCKTLVSANGEVAEADRVDVGLAFPANYLEEANPARVICLLSPRGVFHPNVLGPAVCVGRMSPGTGLVDLIYQIYEIVTYQRRTTHDFLNPAAAEWARNHQERFPLDSRPLVRRQLAVEGELEVKGGAA